MKTIEEAAKEYAFYQYEGEDIGVLFTETKNDFKAGVKFAQQWISVDDELPENGEQVLVKYNGCGNIEYIDVSKYFMQFCVNGIATHWRPIEYK